MDDRRAGLLLHPTSLAGTPGAGDLGAAAHRFASWLAEAGARAWQVLPLGPTGYGESPYQALSSQAGNPLLVSLEVLRNEGWLEEADLRGGPTALPGRADLHATLAWKRDRLARAARAFARGATPEVRADVDDFRAREGPWLEDWAIFATLKDEHGGAPWPRWPAPLARRDPAALDAARARFAAEIDAHVFAQWAFFQQWTALHDHCRALGVALVGDLPIYVAHDSVEAWAHPGLFRLDATFAPTRVAGVPPDYFSATGQRWGNPLYDWPAVAKDGWRFWVDRVRASLALVDRVRLDHFRGFEAFWAVPASAATAAEGRWEPGPGAALFEALEAALGPLPFIAENLGVITPEVEALRRRFRFPGMAILQFAFGNDAQAASFRPDRYTHDTVAYTGTHDNDTVAGWWEAGPAGSVRSAADVAREKAFAADYLGLAAGATGAEVAWALVRAVVASVADTAIIAVQDLLGLGSEARMNRPSTLGDNWSWRLVDGALTPELAARLRRLCELYGR